MIRKSISLGADSWQSIGLIALYEGLASFDEENARGVEIFENLSLDSHALHMSYDPEFTEDVRQFLYGYVRHQMNQVPLLPIELKILQRNEKFVEDEEGFLPVRMPMTLDKDDLEYIKQEKDHLGRPKVYLKNPARNVDITLMRNFIGIRKDWEFLRKTYRQIVDDFIYHLELPADTHNTKICSLCSSVTTAKLLYQMNQSRNPFMSQHHNTKVRGYFGSVNKGRMCAICHFLNVLASLYVQTHPYFVSTEEITHLLIPETNDLRTFRKVLDRFQRSLSQLDSATTSHYRTNIEHIGQRSLYPAMFALYYWMENEVALQKKGYSRFTDNEKRTLQKWVIPRFKKGQNVIFRNFSELKTNEVHFQLVKQIYYGAKKDKRGNILEQFINRLRFQDPRLLDKLTEGIWHRNWSHLRDFIFVIFKRKIQDRERYLNWNFVASFFHAYLDYLILEVEKLIDDRVHADLKKLASVISNNCVSRENGKAQVDIGLLTKFHNATSVETFRRVLAELGFVIMKKDSADTKQTDNADVERFHVGPARLERIMGYMQDEKMFRQLRDILMIYVSSYAHQRYVQNVESKEVEGGTE